MLAQLVTGSSAQTSSLQGVLDGSAQTVALLRQLVDLTAQQNAESAAAKAARDAAYAAEVEASRKAAEQKAAQDAAAAAAATTSATTGAASQQTFEQFAAARGYTIAYIGDDDRMRFYNADGEMMGPGFGGQLMTEFSQLRGYASGGLPYGLSILGERGPELVDFTTPARVYTHEQTRGMFAPRDDGALIEEIKGLRAEVATLRNAATITASSTRKTSDILLRVTRDGESVLTEAAP